MPILNNLETALGASPFEFTRKQALKIAKTLRSRALKFDEATQAQLKKKKVSEQTCGGVPGFRKCNFRSDVKLANSQPGPCEHWQEL